MGVGMTKPFLEELRSDRHWMTLFFLGLTLLIAALGAYLFAMAFVSGRGTSSIKIMVAAFIALPFTVGFACAAAILIHRWLRGPVLVRIDLKGITVGTVFTPWTSVNALIVTSSGWGDRVWVQVQCKRGHGSGFMIPGPPFPWTQWDPLADALLAYFAQARLEIHVD